MWGQPAFRKSLRPHADAGAVACDDVDVQHRRHGALVGLTVSLALAACGSGSDGVSSPDATDQPAVETLADDSSVSEFTEGGSSQDAVTESDESSADDPSTEDANLTDEAAPDEAAPDADAADTIAPDGDEPDVAPPPEDTTADAPTTEPATTDVPPPTEPAVTEAPAPAEPAEPVVGGRTLATSLEPAAQFDGNPFPDLVVDDVGKSTQVNLANILPSDRPVLLWAWAPH